MHNVSIAHSNGATVIYDALNSTSLLSMSDVSVSDADYFAKGTAFYGSQTRVVWSGGSISGCKADYGGLAHESCNIGAVPCGGCSPFDAQPDVCPSPRLACDLGVACAFGGQLSHSSI